MEFKKLADVEVLESATDEANVLIEENGEIKRVPKTEVGGTGFPTAIIKDSLYDNALAGNQNGGRSTRIATPEPEPEITYECINMTFEEAYDIVINGGVLNAIGMLVSDPISRICNLSIIVGSGFFGIPCLILGNDNTDLFWTADGISMNEPNSGGK